MGGSNRKKGRAWLSLFLVAQAAAFCSPALKIPRPAISAIAKSTRWQTWLPGAIDNPPANTEIALPAPIEMH
jgi:hypothetical protein